VSRDVTIGLAQVTGAAYAAEDNRALSVRAARDLFARGADLVVLPELIVSGYALDPERLAAIAEPLDGPTIAAWTALAAETGGWLAGGFCERAGDAIHNSAVLVGPDGVALHYSKLQLFREEKHAFAPGDLGLPVVQTPLGSIGMCLCYDLRFPEIARILALKGAEIICVPTAWVAGFDTARWDAEGYATQARNALLQANLNQAFIACASQAGERHGFVFLGSSLLCDPYGKPLLGPLPGDVDALDCTTVDVDAAQRALHREPLLDPRADRRTDVYGLAIAGEVL
jgi:N-carbamoylputrescine amidase